MKTKLMHLALASALSAILTVSAVAQEKTQSPSQPAN